MSNLRKHEKIVLDRLVSGTIAPDLLEKIKENARISDYYATGYGYFLTIEHAELPAKRIVCSEPMVVGDNAGIETGFVVFIENRSLTIECYSLGADEVPRDYRDRHVTIS